MRAMLPVEQRTGEAIANSTLTPAVQSVERSPWTDQFCQVTSWPKDKPIADIVFPQIISTKDEVTAALWVMLPQQEIQKRLSSTRYNQFLFIMSPHPMMLWITVLHNREHGPKWFPYYLDLKTRQGKEITGLLGETGCYRLLLFARESPEQPCACLLLTIAPAQSQRLQQWAITSQTLVSAGEAQFSKSLLKKEFEKLKPQIRHKSKWYYIQRRYTWPS